MFLVFHREVPLFFFNPKGREGILLQPGGERGGRGDCLGAAMRTLLVGVWQPGAHWALFSLPVPTWPPDAKNQLIGKDPNAGKD